MRSVCLQALLLRVALAERVNVFLPWSPRGVTSAETARATGGVRERAFLPW